MHGFDFVLFGDFYLLPGVEANHYDAANSEIFAERCDRHMLELICGLRAEHGVDIHGFIID
jgi:hypothetical protein